MLGITGRETGRYVLRGRRRHEMMVVQAVCLSTRVVG